VAGLITEPSKGLKEEGAVGFAKGLGKGTVGLLTKTSTGMLGVYAAHTQEIY
jgi:sterol 3beta-glucosyltransferase